MSVASQAQKFFAEVNTSSAATHKIVAGITGRQIYIVAMTLLINGANVLTWESGQNSPVTDLIPASGFNFGAAAQFILPLRGYKDAYVITNAGDDLNLITSTGAQVSGTIEYYQQ